jgi:hypothetical protein
MYYKIASILLNNEQKSGAASDIFIAQPDAQKEALVGKLFILAEIQTPGSDAAKILKFLIGNLNYNYYQNEKVILKERIDTISLESIFESTLAKTNKDLAEFITQEKIKISPYAFNVAICVLYKNEIYFSGIGKNKILLIYKEKATLKQKEQEDPELKKIEYKISDVGETPENEALNINKLFSNIINGKIPVGSYFLIINEALSEYLSNKQLIRIITKLSPTGAAEQIRSLLEQINSYVSFLGIIIKNTVSTSLSGEELKNQLEEEIKVDDYKPGIAKTEEKTETIMNSAGIVNLKKWLKTIGSRLKPVAAPTAKRLTKKMFLLKEKIFFKKRAGFISLEKIRKIFQKIGQSIGILSAFILKLSTQKKESALKSGPKIPAAPDKSVPQPLHVQIEELPFFSGKKTKIILTIALIFVVVFTVSLFLTGQKNKEAEKLRTFNALLSSIEKNQNKIDDVLIFCTDTVCKAEIKDLFNQDKDLLAQIPAAKIAQRGDVKSLFDRQQQQSEKIQNKIQNINKLSNLKKIADFSNLTALADPQNLLFANNLIYAGDAKNNAVFKIDVKENIVTAIYNLGLATSSALAYPNAGQNNSIYYLNNGEVLQLDKTDQLSRLKLTLPSTAENIVKINTYENNLYITDKSLGQIYKYTRVADDFTNKKEWLKEKPDLTAVTDIFIDGNIYLLYKNGQVEMYFGGKKQELTLETIDSPIENATKLIVTPNYYYILESGKKRLIVFNNKGAYLAQYVFADLNTVKDFEVNVTDKKIYILGSNSVYEINQPVLK